jgi:hypothetical protein
MNEQIKQLAEQAGLKWKAQPLHYTNTNNPIDFPVSANRDLEKFAELIVKECAKVCDELQKWPSTEPRHCASDIKIHFGVEEMKRMILIEKEPMVSRWYTGKVGVTVEYVPRYDDEMYYGCRDTDGYINFVVKTDGKLL